jgi:hypothetical protein
MLRINPLSLELARKYEIGENKAEPEHEPKAVNGERTEGKKFWIHDVRE